MKTMTTIDNLIAAEQITHIAIDMIAQVLKAIVTLIFVMARGAFRLGQIAREYYERTEEVQTIKACKALAAAKTYKEEYNILEDGVETIVTPVNVETITDPWGELDTDYVNAEVEALNDKISEIYDLQMMEMQLALPAANDTNIEDISYEKTGRGRCKKGYRKVGNRCVLIEHMEVYKTLV